MAALGTGGKREETEWDQILKEKGIIPQKTEQELMEEQLEALVETVVDNYEPHENKDLDELDEDLDEADSDEEKILLKYRERRLEEMKKDAMRMKFGPGLSHISASDWKQEVTEAGEGINVVILLYQPAIENCKFMLQLLRELSAKFRNTKFLECIATDAVKNYPDANLPAVLVYRDGKCLRQFVTLKDFKGLKTTADDVEWELCKLKAVESEMVEPPSKDDKKFTMRRI